LINMISAWLVVIRDYDAMSATEGRTVAGTPLPRSHGVRGGNESKGLQGANVSLAFDDVHRFSTLDRGHDFREVVQHWLDALKVPDIGAGVCRIRAALVEIFGVVAHGLMYDIAVCIVIVINHDDAFVAVSAMLGLQKEMGHREA